MLAQIQARLKAPKKQFNSFGKYNYRSCEDILEALKPILAELDASVVMEDCIINIGNRFYVRSEASLMGSDLMRIASATGWAREADTKKGMDESQITGAASSYARKFALGGLFAIDDNADSDALDNEKWHQKDPDPDKPNVSYDIKDLSSIDQEKAKIPPAPAIAGVEIVDPGAAGVANPGVSGTETDLVQNLLTSFEDSKVVESVDEATQDGRLYRLNDISDPDLRKFAEFANARIGGYEGGLPGVNAKTLDGWILSAKSTGSLEDRKRRASKKGALDKVWQQFIAHLTKR